MVEASRIRSHLIHSARHKNTIEAKIKLVVLIVNMLTKDDPAILPKDAPAEIIPKSRLLESRSNTSVSKLQALEITKRLNTDTHT